jgi:alkylated DNA repair protein (DNA oxidative demethylase)
LESIRPRLRIWERQPLSQGPSRFAAHPWLEPEMTAQGFGLYPAYLDAQAQQALVEAVFRAVEDAPFYRPRTPGGQAMSVEMTNLGPVGWMSDAAGYRYQAHHPFTGRSWPPMPARLVALWADLAGGGPPADACLVNLYRPGARMGLHQDRDEADFRHPVISVSLGDHAIFRLGGADRRASTCSVRLASGDVCVLAGKSRLAYHGVDRIIAGSSTLVPGGGRLNLTLRRAL